MLLNYYLNSPGLYSKLYAEGLPSRVEKATLAPVSGVMSEYSEVQSALSSAILILRSLGWMMEVESGVSYLSCNAQTTE